MIRHSGAALLVVFAVLVQSTVLPSITTLPGKPDLVLVVVVSFGILRGNLYGLGLGFLGGLLLDALNGRLLGLNVGGKLLAGAIAGFLSDKVFRENRLVPLVAALAGTLADQALHVFVLRSFGFSADLTYGLLLIVLPVLGGSSLLAVVLYPVFARADGFLAGYDRSSWQKVPRERAGGRAYDR